MALNNLAVLETYLKDIIFTEAEITANVEMREHIFEIKDAEHSLGFISLYDLKAYVLEHEEEARNYSVKNIDEDQWLNIFEHPYFQRRKPQLVSAESLSSDDDDLQFFILQKGQKTGPFEKGQLLEMVENREILLTDMVSYNGGHVWSKLYQVDGFDRRALRDSDQLPGKPDSDLLNRPSEVLNNIGETTDAFTSLAFLGNLKKGRTIEKAKESSYQDEMSKKAKTSSIYKWLLVVSVLGIVYFLYSIKSQLSSPFANVQTTSVGEQAEMLTPVEEPTNFNAPNARNSRTDSNGFNSQRRMGKFETRKLNPVRPASKKSFMETKTFQDSLPQDDSGTSEDSNYYYDNASPMELDPVRAQISKENFDSATMPAPAPEGEPLFNQESSN
ncbi:MAG: hypothetical protein WC635_13950 [Bacteriovorax sp.]|jgi:hypothetical protein